MDKFDALRMGLDALAYYRVTPSLSPELPAVTLYMEQLRVAVVRGIDYSEHLKALEPMGWRVEVLNSQPFFILAI